jgi:hypothetical protein
MSLIRKIVFAALVLWPASLSAQAPSTPSAPSTKVEELLLAKGGRS